MKEQIYAIFFFIYLIGTFFFVWNLIFKEKPKNRVINFAILYWFLTFNFYKSIVMWRTIPQLWHLRKADFLLAWFLTIMLLMLILSNRYIPFKKGLAKIHYEKYLFIYFGFVFIMYAIHYNLGNLNYYKAITFSRLYLDALLIYLTMRYFVSKELIRMLIKAIIYLAVLSSIASIIQFYVDTRFLRVGFFHFAYPGHNRSSGLFFYPYDNGVYQILATYTVAYYYRDWKIKAILITLFIVSLFLVFTRGTWIAFAAVTIFHLYYYYKKNFKRIIALGLVAAVLSSMIVGAYFAQKDLFSGGYTERVVSDTVTVRMAFYAFIIEAIPKKWLVGYGDVENNEVYYKGMVNAEQSLAWALGRRGGIHNMFLEEAFLRGIFSPILMVIFFLSFVKFNIKMSIEKNNYIFCIFNYFVLGFFLYFNSVSGFLLSRTGFLCIPIMGMIAGIYYKDIDLTGILPERDLKAAIS